MAKAAFRVLGRLFGLFTIVAVLACLSALPAAASTTSTSTAASTLASTAPNPNSPDNFWLAIAAITFGVLVSLALVYMVSKDRRESRKGMAAAIGSGASNVTRRTPLLLSVLLPRLQRNNY